MGGGRRARIFVGWVRGGRGRKEGRVEVEDMAPYYLCLWTSSNFGEGEGTSLSLSLGDNGGAGGGGAKRNKTENGHASLSPFRYEFAFETIREERAALQRRNGTHD